MMACMPARNSTIEVRKESDELAVAQLNRILASKAFRQADRLKRFLTFIVEETLAGRSERLKEFVVGVEVFGKDTSFDPGNDPIVRVQARRLRAQLSRYYQEEGHSDELLIELPKGGYAPQFRTAQKTTGRPQQPALLSRNSVLVLPFADHSARGDQEHFCHGLSEELVRALSGLRAIRLVASTAAPETLGQMDVREIGSRFNVGLLITGSVRTDGSAEISDTRITVNLIDCQSGCYLWSESTDRGGKSAFAIQEEVAGVVGRRLESELTAGSHLKAQRPTENLAAYNLYLQGRYHLNQRTEEGLRKAVEFFEKAIAEDAQYSQAYSGLSDAYGLLGHYGVLSPAEVWTKTASNAAWAVLQDENSAEAHTSLAHAKSTQDWDWLGAEREFQRAIALDPRYPTAHHWYAMSCLIALGKLDAALEEIRLAEALDPISPIIARDVARVHFYRRDFEAALEQCDHAIGLNPHFSPAYWILGLVQEQREEFDEALAAIQRAIQLSPNSPMMQAALARIQALSGQKDEARRGCARLKDLAGKRYVSPFDIATVLFALDETKEGFEWLAKAYQDRCFELVCVRADPRLEPVRSHPRFRELFQQLGLEG